MRMAPLGGARQELGGSEPQRSGGKPLAPLSEVDARAWAWVQDGRRWVGALPGLRPTLSGVAGGVAMAAYLVVAMSIAGEGPLVALRAIGASHPLGGGVLAGTVMHFVTASFWGLRLGDLLQYAPPRFESPRAALALGALWGVALWLVMGLVIGPLFSPSIARTDPGHYLVAHLVYGIASTLALTYVRRRSRGRAPAPRRGSAGALFPDRAASGA